MMVYSKRHLENDFPVVVSQNFSIDFLKSKVAEKYPDVEKNPIVLIECGVTFFNLMMDAAEFVDILMITELEGDENHEYLVGEIKMEIVSENYEICHVSHTVTNESGNWKMIVFKKKNP